MSIRERIAKIRAHIAELKAEHATVEAQRRSRKEVGEYLDAIVAHWHSQAQAMGRTNASRAAAGAPAEFLTIRIRAMTPQGPALVSIDVGPLAVLLLGQDAVRKALAKTLADVPDGLNGQARVERLQALSATLHTAQIEEENLIREAEQGGEIIPYRLDADPAYTLTWRTQE